MSELVSRVMRGRSMQQMLRRRDAAGGEMEILARLMNDPNPTPKEITEYVHKLVRMEHVPPHEADQILATIPRDPAALHAWARTLFATIMHQGIHAHAAFPLTSFPRASVVSEGSPESSQEDPSQ